MAPSGDGSAWGLLGVAGAISLCCIGLATLAGGAAVAGGTAAGATAARGTSGGLGGILATVFATALPLLVIGVIVRRRGYHG